jgi:asparagine synthase (glutamine-hydrolysing)
MAQTPSAERAPGAARVIAAQPGASFDQTAVRRRPTDTVRAGAALPDLPAAKLQAPDPQAAELQAAKLQADWDSCWLDDRQLTTLDDWQRVIDGGRLADVEGSFVVAWRDDAGVTHLARDGVGGRSMFYALSGSGLAYAGALPELLASVPIRRRLNLAAVARYLATAYVPGRETLVEDVFEVLPGEEVTCAPDGHLTRRPFWQLPADGLSRATEADMRHELRRLLERATRRLLPPAGEPVGATLSGGVDSSLVVALARRLHDAPVHTWSVSFGDRYPNELAFSSLVAGHCESRHTIVELSPAVILRHLDETIGLLSDPIGDPLTVPNALLFREASSYTGIVLNGEGGDPCFGGPKNQPMVLAELYTMPDGERPSRATNYLRSHLKCYDDFGELLSSSMQEALALAPLENWLVPMLGDPRWPDYVSRLQAMNIALKGAHHILPKVDALSRRFGVLPRSPLFDRAVVEHSLRLPPRLKLNGAVEKHLLKEAVRDLLPEAIIARPKSGMLVPVEGWFKGPLLPAARERILDGLASYGLFQRNYLERLLAGRLGGLRPRHGAKIWLLITLEAWLRNVFHRF